MQIDQLIDRIYLLPESSKQKLKNNTKEVFYPKGHILLKADRVEEKLYFIKKGVVRAFAKTPDQEITFWFGKEGDTALSMKSFVGNQKGYEDIELLEDSELFQIDALNLQQLFKEDIHIANWGRKYAENELLKTEERLISRLLLNATERYLELINNDPTLIQRVQLRYIASYLGITQVSLSRIRASL
ncbi:Crp/Fnr family transcriptional regulator [Algoriphagus halophilus]|uniref:Crp/Fnr family transcriptional regulator n=1 Tax=Algoriphagus halophilus TaxID=226505 RepID=UPI00358F0E4F